MEPVDRWATAERRELGAIGGAAGSTGQGGIWGLEAGGRGKVFSSHGDDGGWQTRRAYNVQMVG